MAGFGADATSRTSITGACALAPVRGATCTSAITAACRPSEIHRAASGHRSRGGIDGSSNDALTDCDTLGGIAVRETSRLYGKTGSLA